MHSRTWTKLVVLLSVFSLRLDAQLGWQAYGGDPGGQRFSAAKQITPENVHQLKPAWIFHTHAVDHPRMALKMAAFEATPVLLDKTLYVPTPFDQVFAVDAETGKQLWAFDPNPKLAGETNLTTSRGVAVWSSKGSGMCAARVFVGTLDGRLFAVDAKSGQPCLDFGGTGFVDAKLDVGYHTGDVYEITSAPAVIGDVVIVGSSIPDGIRLAELRGTVHAYDVRSGKLLWAWDPIGSWAMQLPADRRAGAANAWSTMSADPALGLVYIPTGNSSAEYYGALRPGDDRDANSVVALDAKTGRRVWGFQVVHHDLWDYDVAAEPVLFTWRGKTPAIAIGTKMGLVFVLDRRTGQPLFPVEERSVPASDIPGEVVSPTQPFSSLPTVNPTNLNDPGEEFKRTSEEAQDCSRAMASKRYNGIYTPPSIGGSLQFTGAIGGINWGGMAFDPVSHVLYANSNSDVHEVDLIPRAEMEEPAPTKDVRLAQALLRIPHLKRVAVLAALLILALGSLLRHSWNPGPYAIVIGILALLLIPAGNFARERLILKRQQVPMMHVAATRHETFGPQNGTPYWLRVKPLADRNGMPCSKLPWGALNAINLDTGTMVFRVPHGPDTNGQHTGSLSVSGPIVTAGGVIFSAGTKASVLYAYDAKTGQRLAELPMPVPAQATPMSYSLHGKQYVVIADGGHGPLEMKLGDNLIAFTLPSKP